MQLLDQVRVAKPCPASWSEMSGDDRARHCSLCRLNVYNLSGMTRDEAESFLQKAEGRVCVRYYERADGKVMTRDCPKGMAAVRKSAAMSVLMIATVWTTAVSFLLAKPIPRAKFEEVKAQVRESEPIKSIIDKMSPPPPVVMGKMSVTMGMVAPTPPTHVPKKP